jgi:hypothetical protein
VVNKEIETIGSLNSALKVKNLELEKLGLYDYNTSLFWKKHRSDGIYLSSEITLSFIRFTVSIAGSER